MDKVERLDLIIIGGASGVDYLVERWATNQAIPMAIFLGINQDKVSNLADLRLHDPRRKNVRERNSLNRISDQIQNGPP